MIALHRLLDGALLVRDARCPPPPLHCPDIPNVPWCLRRPSDQSEHRRVNTPAQRLLRTSRSTRSAAGMHIRFDIPRHAKLGLPTGNARTFAINEMQERQHSTRHSTGTRDATYGERDVGRFPLERAFPHRSRDRARAPLAREKVRTRGAIISAEFHVEMAWVRE